MFGNIISIIDESVKIENAAKRVEAALIGMHLVFENQHKIVCEISSMTREEINCVMVGEFIDNVFHSGIIHKPAYDSKIRLINKDEVIALLGSQKVDDSNSLYIGKSVNYEGFNVSADIDSFFSNHFAIIGNTGSGKSCSIARLFQNLFYRKEYVPVNSNIALFDVYGEYKPALDMINRMLNVELKLIKYLVFLEK